MTHAILAQHNLIWHMQIRQGALLPHMTDLEQFGWEPADYTEQCYRTAGWGAPDARYWIGTTEAKRRLAILDADYSAIGIHDLGRRHNFDFPQPAAAQPAAVQPVAAQPVAVHSVAA